MSSGRHRGPRGDVIAFDGRRCAIAWPEPNVTFDSGRPVFVELGIDDEAPLRVPAEIVTTRSLADGRTCVTLDLHDPDQGRRTQHRLPFDGAVEIMVISGRTDGRSGDPNIRGVATDLSIGGLGFASTREFAPRTVVLCRFRVPPRRDTTFQARAVIAHCRPDADAGFECGAEFTKVTTQQHEQLRTALGALLRPQPLG